MSESTVSGSSDAVSGQDYPIGLLPAPLSLQDKIDYLYAAAIRIEKKVDWCVQTVTAATTALGNMPFGGSLLKKMGNNNG